MYAGRLLSILLTLRVRRLEEEHGALEYVLSFGAAVEVVAPPTWRALVLRAAEEIVALYARSPVATTPKE